MGYLILFILIAGAAFLLLWQRRKRSCELMDSTITAEKVKNGVEKGWYKAVLLRVKNVPAVRLTSTTSDGARYSNVWPMSEADWQELKADGYTVVK